MKKTLPALFLIALSIATAPIATAALKMTDPISESIASGDSAYRAFDYDRAIKCYEIARAKSPNCAVLLKLADAYFYGGYQKPKVQQEQMYLSAKDALLCALKLDSTSVASAETYARLGQVSGQIALFRGGNEKIKLGLEIKQFADKALERNPNNAMANAVLGIWHYELANLDFVAKAFVKILFGGVPDGSFEFSEKHLSKAVELQPNVIYYRNAYAKTLAKLGKEDEARTQLKQALELPIMVAGDKQNKRESKELLTQM